MNEKSVRSHQPVDKENVKFITANKRKNAKMYVQIQYTIIINSHKLLNLKFYTTEHDQLR